MGGGGKVLGFLRLEPRKKGNVPVLGIGRPAQREDQVGPWRGGVQLGVRHSKRRKKKPLNLVAGGSEKKL